MKLLNIGCGSVFHHSWSNIDVLSSSPEVQTYDIKKGLPYADSYFNACYSSHLLEHLTQTEAEKFLLECWRILQPQAVIRIVVPDLEAIVINYLEVLEKSQTDKSEEANYKWIILELYDQAVRSFSGGEMGHYLSNNNIENKEFIVARIGQEAEKYWWQQENNIKTSIWEKIKSKKPEWFFKTFRIGVAKVLVKLVAGQEAKQAFEEGLFRNTGEIHRWMYDRFSLKCMLEQSGFVDVKVCRSDESQIPNFNSYGLDMVDNKIRKPDSLFMEAIKP
ncbi:class I SAM-dependent methyltransferase [Synechocystis sp. PCC 7509]|uniref:class I SAM-dependent methyltransferase n=1 Tax=Synechocystis sp. PCC 7509 TaxID=927677 RepID=UPI0002ACA12D|nr:methyltransferase domain-containing protein [Synechocystis sp. PCC 7509]